MKLLTLVALCIVFKINDLSTLTEADDACGVNGVCSCFDQYDYLESIMRFHVECPNRSLTHIPRNIPSNVSEMGLSGNELEDISSETFPALPVLNYLELSDSNIRYLLSDTFHKLCNLSILSLSKNQIELFTAESFRGLENLCCLYLDSNKIRSFPADTFRPLINLRQIFLSRNLIETLPEKSFHGLTSLQIIYLDNNIITRLLPGIFWGLPNLTKLNLVGNNIKEIYNDVFDKTTPMLTLELSRNSIERLHPASFRGLENLTSLNLSNNELSNLPKDVFIFTPRLRDLSLSFNRLRDVPDGVFAPLRRDLRVTFIFRVNQLKVLPNLSSNVSRRFFKVDFSRNVIKNLKNTHLVNVNKIERLYFSRNQISVIPKDIFSDLNLGELLDLSDNRIEELPQGLFSRNESHGLVFLLLQRNLIKYIPKNAFLGLDNLKIVCLFSNVINVLEEGSLSGNSPMKIYLFQNNLTKIDNDPFGINEISQVHLYGNKIETISEKALLALKNDSLLYVSCDFLKRLPRDSSHELITCVSPWSLPVISLTQYDLFIKEEFETGGFSCNISDFTAECVPCGKGTYGDWTLVGCQNCPKGGFYQDEVGQVSSELGGMSCKTCNVGTYVKEGHGTSIQECQVCPDGTNQGIAAGFRACFCKDKYARTDRYGPCKICLEEGLNCSHEFQLLRPGYFWSWNFTAANLTNYIRFVENLQKEEKNLTEHFRYIEEIPRALPCQRSLSCPNSNGVVEGQCADGYKGWLCSSCEPEYYSVLNTCVACPSKEVLILEVGVFVSVFVFICYLFSWQIKNDAMRHSKQRSLINVAISRVKILLGFYQVVGEIFASLHEINWTGPLVLIGTFISSLELNILRIFIRPRCFSERLIMSPQIKFIIGVSCPVAIIVLPILLYQAKRLHLKCKSLVYRVPYVPAHLRTIRLRLNTCVIVLMFVTYPNICSVIFELYPKACKTFYLDKDGNYSVTRLRSDLNVDCGELVLYHYCAYFFTVTYVITFPTVLLLMLWKYCSRSQQTRFNVANINSLHSDSDSSTSQEDFVTENSSTSSSAVPVWLNFLCENYKRQFWFWEIIELARKVTQTLLITLYGWEDRLTVLLTTCISVLFLTLHARYRPMKSSHEQRLQMLSLTVIFINVVIASNEEPSKYDGAVSIILILLNVLILLIIAGEIFITFLRHIKQLNVTKFTYLVCLGLRKYLQRRRQR